MNYPLLQYNNTLPTTQPAYTEIEKLLSYADSTNSVFTQLYSKNKNDKASPLQFPVFPAKDSLTSNLTKLIKNLKICNQGALKANSLLQKNITSVKFGDEKIEKDEVLENLIDQIFENIIVTQSLRKILQNKLQKDPSLKTVIELTTEAIDTAKPLLLNLEEIRDLINTHDALTEYKPEKEGDYKLAVLSSEEEN